METLISVSGYCMEGKTNMIKYEKVIDADRPDPPFRIIAIEQTRIGDIGLDYDGKVLLIFLPDGRTMEIETNCITNFCLTAGYFK